MHSQIRVMFHGIYWRMSCGCCDRGICFDDRAAAIQAAREHAFSHDLDMGAHTELVLVEDGDGEMADWALASDPELVQFDPAEDFHSLPVAIAIPKRAENPAAFRN